MVAIKLKWRGSYTVEGTVVVSIACMMIALICVFGFYGHDRSVMNSTANEIVLMASLWKGRYVSPEINEVDYEALKNNMEADLSMIENKGYQWLDERLLYGKVQSVRVFSSFLSKRIRVEMVAGFNLFGYEFEYKVQSSFRYFESEDLPRKPVESGEEE